MTTHPMPRPIQALDGQSDSYWCAKLSHYLMTNIPLCKAMALEVREFNSQELVFFAPLAPNINDKGTAFGGATASLLTICGWSVVWLLSQAMQPEIDIVIRQSQVRYHRPAESDLWIRCPLPDADTWHHFTLGIQRKKRARITLKPILESNKHLAASLAGEYAAFERNLSMSSS